MKKHVVIFLVSNYFFGCASPTYRFQSTPSEADVDVIFKSSGKKSLGKTPLTLPMSDLNPTKEAMTVSFRKPGLEGQTIFVPPSLFAKSVELDVTLTPDPRVGESKKSDQVIGEIATQVAETQKLIQAKQFGVAEQKLNKMISEHPTVSVFYSLMGNVQYLDRKLDAALGFYRKALELDPSAGEISRVIQKIETLKGGGPR